jgi:hypothetical protein
MVKVCVWLSRINDFHKFFLALNDNLFHGVSPVWVENYPLDHVVYAYPNAIDILN